MGGLSSSLRRRKSSAPRTRWRTGTSHRGAPGFTLWALGVGTIRKPRARVLPRKSDLLWIARRRRLLRRLVASPFAQPISLLKRPDQPANLFTVGIWRIFSAV